jgi:hypothetical protein
MHQPELDSFLVEDISGQLAVVSEQWIFRTFCNFYVILKLFQNKKLKREKPFCFRSRDVTGTVFPPLETTGD